MSQWSTKKSRSCKKRNNKYRRRYHRNDTDNDNDAKHNDYSDDIDYAMSEFTENNDHNETNNDNEHKDQQQEPYSLPKYLKEYIILSMEKSLPNLESTYILSDIVSSSTLTTFDPNDDENKLQLLNHIISKLTTKLQSLSFVQYKNEPKHYMLSNCNNKWLLINGYSNGYNNMFNFSSPAPINFIPADIIQLIYKFYDNSLVWTIDAGLMHKFRRSKHKDIIHGPQLKPMKGITFELALCPMGWKKRGFTVCYLEMIEMAEDIEGVTIDITLYLKELNVETKAAHKFTYIGSGMCHPCIFFHFYLCIAI